MPWMMFHAFNDEDAHALAAYLKSLPPLHRLAPDSVSYGTIESLVMKVAAGLPAAIPQRLIYLDGDSTGLESARPLERLLIRAQWLVLALFTLGFLFGGQRPSGAGGWAKRLAGLAGLAILGFVLHLISVLPAAKQIPPERIAAARLGEVPQVKGDGLSPQQRVLADRGRYLFQTTSCAFCHRPDGSGGAKLSWKSTGTLYVRNITSDRETGIGAWTDAQILRALRSGISRDRPVLHWQGMTWDLFSNLEEEDARAVLAYLRQLPPVKHQVPAARPPALDDCDDYTFFPQSDLPPGCRD